MHKLLLGRVSPVCRLRYTGAIPAGIPGFLFSCIQPSAAWPVFPCVCRLRYTGTFRLPVFLHFSLQPPARRFLLPAACCKQTRFQSVILGSPFSSIQAFSRQPGVFCSLPPAVNRLSSSPAFPGSCFPAFQPSTVRPVYPAG